MVAGDFKQSTNLNGKILASGVVNPAYVISFAGPPSGGTFTPTIVTGVNGSAPNSQSVAITYTTSLTAAAVQTALQALTGMSSVTVAGSNGGPYTITIPVALGVATVSVVSALTGGTSPIAAVAGAGVETTIYTVPASSAVKVATFSLANASTAGAVSASVVPSGGTADGTRRVLSAIPIAANDTISQDDVLAAVKGAMLDTGAFISVAPTTPVTYLLTGAVSN